MKQFFKRLSASILCISALISIGGCSSNSAGAFEKTKWGMSAVEINDSTNRILTTNEDGSVKSDNPGSVDFIPENEGAAKNIVYYFDKTGGLQQITVTVKPEFGNNAEKLSETITETFNRRFKTKGVADKSITAWQVKGSKITLWQQSDSLLICFEKDE